VKGYLLIALSAAAFGLMPFFALSAYHDGLNVTTLLFLRFGIAAVILFCYGWWRRELRRLTAREAFLLFALGGVLYTAQSTFYFSAVQYISPALAVLLLYLYPALVTGLSALVNKENISLTIYFSIAFSFIGVTFTLGWIELGNSILGIILSVGAALVYAIYIVFGDRICLTVPPLITSAYVTLFAAVSFAIFGSFSGGLVLSFPASAWMPTIAVALISTVLAIGFFFAGIEAIGATRAAIVSNLEPVVNIVAAVVLLNATMTLVQLAGALMVLSGSTLGMLSRATS
jgi:drug/metabolite transporter (DMT)-like permease